MAKKSELATEERMVDAVLSLLRREESAAVLARRYQVSGVTLYRWRDLFLAAGKIKEKVREAVQAHPPARLKAVVRLLGLACSSFFRQPAVLRRG